MNCPDDKDIVVRIEIRVPTAGAAPHSLKLLTSAISIPGAIAKVKVGPGGNWICAMGSAGNGMLSLTGVFGQVSPGNVTCAATFPYGALSGNAHATGQWDFTGTKLLPGAVCSSDPYNLPQNTLCVWYQWSNGSITGPDKVLFRGQCSTQTDCDSFLLAGCPGAAAPETLLATSARQWKLTVSGFSAGAAQAFNKKWTLALRPPHGEHSVWDNGGDGKSKPLIELRRDNPFAPHFRLTLQSKQCTVCYLKPAAEWQPLGANVFTALESASGVALGEFPNVVTLEPA